jgi:dTDP-4-dehydrorhamnose 3,5-epimerase
MIFTPVAISGVWLIDLDRKIDNRGYFARTWCREEFAEHGLSTDLVQTSVSFNVRKGTLRGMHWQAAPHEEIKLIRCVRGAVYDVLLDLRMDSPTFKKWIGIELDENNGRSLYVPEGIAHGFQTLRDSTEVCYYMSHSFHAESASGVRWNDPSFGIEWPAASERIISQRDATYLDFK